MQFLLDKVVFWISYLLVETRPTCGYTFLETNFSPSSGSDYKHLALL